MLVSNQADLNAQALIRRPCQVTKQLGFTGSKLRLRKLCPTATLKWLLQVLISLSQLNNRRRVELFTTHTGIPYFRPFFFLFCLRAAAFTGVLIASIASRATLLMCLNRSGPN